ncbi:phytoene dehydrogenase [Mycolicibacterium chubuense]|uniref:Pyridine nucleotide-disulfide oxidoreductase domain-containing protein 2 n=1 Tax=Mycolicibacterium chubuense TaxID=1800 RepID=A0A0J6WKE8_MYCCU|nr:NAD(P)/FAD-dependent oxidoreductase [Mycolicibacterium chubuense]KMO83079.1 Phytoene desaturase (lycopene-forming) [Mycolicibacterium chubuense]ORA48966.1 phytoene dehydrogenase [Mycolicibacterium chubuense]SPY00710.1 FAD dependent oxidoreductase [Mycolicibacterium chubuense]
MTSTTAPDYDAIVIGAGHNGLITAGYLARAGKRVLVVEARDVVGGACTSEELIAGATWSSCAFIASLLRPEIIADLELERYGLQMYQTEANEVSIFPDGSHLFVWKDMDKTLKEIEKFSKRDAAAFLEFGLRVKKFASILTPFLLSPAPSRSQVLAAFEAAGAEDLFNEMVLLSTKDLLDRYFENEHIKGLFTFFGMISVWGGPSTPGTGYVYGHHSVGEFKGTLGQWGFVKGGMGGITQAMARSAEAHGAEIRLGSPVKEVVVTRGRATGVTLADGQTISARTVISNADPQRSMLKLLPAGTLDTKLTGKLESYDARGSMARIHLLIDELPDYIGFPAGVQGPQHQAQAIMGASIENFERAWEAERRGEIPDDFVIEAVIQSTHDSTLAPEGKHTMTLGVQQLPFELAGTDWDTIREEWADKVLDVLFRYAPNLRGHILERVIITPKDLERDYGLTGGNIFHGSMFFDQLFNNRPTPELADYRTPVDNYYLCGSGTHPGGGVMGANGHNAAQVVIADLNGTPAPTAQRVGPAPKSGVIDRAMETVMDTKTGKKLGYTVASSPALRKVVKFAARSKTTR